MRIVVVYSSEAQQGIIDGLIALGHRVVAYNYGLGKLSIISRFYYRVINGRLRKLVALFNSALKNAYEYQQNNPQDLLIIIKGHSITPKAARFLQRIEARKIQWTIDSVTRWPGQSTLFPFMDQIFFQDGSDLAMCANSEWLPLGFDSNLFVFSESKTVDILLLGNLQQPYYSKRRDCFLRLAAFAKRGYRVCFAGSYADKELLSVFNSSGVEVVGRLALKKYANLISQSKICVNIHQDDGGKAINPMFFAIPATGGLELSDDSPYLSEWLEPGRHYYPTSAATICQDILPLLGLRYLPRDVANEVFILHSYQARAKRLLSSIEMANVHS